MRASPTLPVACLVLLATACAPVTTVVQQTPTSVELRWDNDRGSLERAMLVAEAHCAEHGKQPTLDSMSMDQDVSLATIRCR